MRAFYLKKTNLILTFFTRTLLIACLLSFSSQIYAQDSSCILDVSVNTTDPATCGSNGSVDIQISGGSGSEILEVLDSLTNADVGTNLNDLPTGSYVYTVTDGDCQETGSFSINDPLNPDLIVSASGEITCNNLTVTVDGQSSVSNLGYLWTTSDGVIDSGANSATATVSATGTYVLTITNLNTNCTTTESVTVTAQNSPPLPSMEITKSGDITCNTAQVDLTVSPIDNNLTYTWSTTDGTIVSGANSTTASVSAIGTYTLLVEKPKYRLL